jgi:hypothetical protein
MLLGLGALSASPGFAQSVGITDSTPQMQEAPVDPPSDQVIFRITGTNPLDCGVAFGATGLQVDLTASRSVDVPVAVRCNLPFRIRGQAANGALVDRAGAGARTMRNSLAYRVEWPQMMNWSGGVLGEQLSSDGAAWAAGVSSLSGAPIAPQDGTFKIVWDDPRELAAGTYDETFTVEVEVVN